MSTPPFGTVGLAEALRSGAAGRARAALNRGWPAEWIVCGALSLFWFAATAWLRPLALPDEGRYVGVAHEMLASGHWWVPTLDGMPFFHKPPLFYWITAASMRAFGSSVESARAASLLAAVVTVTGLYAFVRRWVGIAEARSTVLVLATMPLFYGGAQYANLDMLVAACVSAAILLAGHATLTREGGGFYRGPLAMAFAAAALGVLAKGLIGVVLPVLVLLGWGVFTGRTTRVLALLAWAPGLVLFSCIAAPWFLAMQAQFPGFDHYFFVVQHFQRFASTGFNNVQPWWFYPVALVALSLPWSPWLMTWLTPGPARRKDPHGLRRLMLVWCAVVMVFFSLPSSKLVGYILPALAPLAFMVADAMRRTEPRGSGQRVSAPRLFTSGVARRASAWSAGAVCVVAVVAAHFYQPKSMQVLAHRLQAERSAGEPVVFLGNYYYDVPFYAGLTRPVLVLDRWAPAEVAHDSWRAELVDAGHFAPDRASALSMRGDEALGLACGLKGAWLVGTWPPRPEFARLLPSAPAQVQGTAALWHLVPPRAAAVGSPCIVMPPGLPHDRHP
ncbi:glycosyltransferase family 39 protein [soil metagenome]